jgi:NDP-sugar pyrophosphorylase family protein
MKTVKVVLMCGGIGKRMSPITSDKALLKFMGTPLIVHQINSAKKAGINQFVIITNPENDSEIQSALSKLRNIQTEFVLQKKSLGMANAILTASKLINGEPFILVSSNDVFDTSAYLKLLQEYRKDNHYSVYITAKQVQNYFPGGYLVMNKQNEVTDIIEKPPKGQEPSNLINIVLHLHTQPKKFLHYLKITTSTTDDIYERTLDCMIAEGQRIRAVPYEKSWKGIKYPWHILETMDYFAEQITPYISPKAIISDRAVIDNNVIVEDNARVLDGAVIRGPSYIGYNTVIGTGALVRSSFIGNDCVIGYGTEIKHSYISDKCWFHSNYIGDSVIEQDCSFGAGAVTANFRLDETNIYVKVGSDKIDTGTDKLGAFVGRGCRIGIHASLMPGIRIGANSFIGAHVYLVEDIEANRKVLAEARYRIMANDTMIIRRKRQELLQKLVEQDSV